MVKEKEKPEDQKTEQYPKKEIVQISKGRKFTELVIRTVIKGKNRYGKQMRSSRTFFQLS